MLNVLYSDFDISAPGANTGIIAGGFSVGKPGAVISVTVALAVGSVLNLTCYDGSTTHKWGLDKSTALQAGDLYTFHFLGLPAKADGTALTYNLEVETDGDVEILVVTEEYAG